jgi:hypothetical protein
MLRGGTGDDPDAGTEVIADRPWSSRKGAMLEQNHIYRGIRIFEASSTGATYLPGWRVEVDGTPLPASDTPRRTSPKGWRWGYEPSSPNRLSHAILSHEFGAEIADTHYTAFTHDVMADLAGTSDDETWTLTSQELHDWLNTRRLLQSVLDELEDDEDVQQG